MSSLMNYLLNENVFIVGCPSPINIYQTEENGFLKDDSIPKLKEELPILSDEMAKKDDTFNKNEVNIKSENDKDKNDENSAPPILLPNNYDNKHSVDGVKESNSIKTEKVDVVEALNNNISEKESNIEESKDQSKEHQLEQSNISEKNNTSSSLSEEKSLDISSTGNKEDTKMDSSSEKVDTNLEIKTEDELKEDDETDIETDLRKEEDEQKESIVSSEESSKTKVSQEINSVVEEPENDDKKYDCDTDTEVKYDTSQINEKDNFSIKKEIDNYHEKSTEMSEKDFSIKSENNIVDIKGISKIIPKDDILHSHVEDSQVNIIIFIL